jgi:hypothetical protein
VGSFVVLIILCVPWFFFLWNLQTLLQRVDPRNRAMPPGHVWLNFIPIFNLGWFIYTVIKIKESLLAEYGTRGWKPEGDQGYNVGIATGVLAIASFFLGWVPVIGWAVGIAQLICWVLYWLKTHELKNRLGGPATWPYTAGGGYPGDRPDPYAPAGPPPYAQQPPQQPAYPWPPQQPAEYGAEPPAAPSAWPAAAAADTETGMAAPAAVVAAGVAAAAAKPAGEAAPEIASAAGVAAAAETTEVRPARTWSAPPVWPTSAVAEGEASAEAAAAGTAEEQVAQCAACGSEYDPEDKFCRSCGLKLP